MKLFFFLVFISINSYGAPCNGAPGKYHQNLDGSNGGFIQNGARVPREAYISGDSEICGKVIIEGTAKIEAGSRIEENVVIQGSPKIVDSHVFGFARISGRAIIENSTICQGSLIEGFKVINSKYYCQTEDPAPKDPGEAGKKTLLGIDSDGDGVRDDVEIWINNSLSNTLVQDKMFERINTKNYAKLLQMELLSLDSYNSLKAIDQKKRHVLSCSNLSLSNEVYTVIYNSKQRLFALLKARGHLDGEKIESVNVNCSAPMPYYFPNKFKGK